MDRYSRKNARTPEQREELRRAVVAAVRAGESRAALGTKHRVSVEYIGILLRESGIFGWGKHPVRVSKRNAKIVEAHAAGMSRASIALRFKLSQSQLSNVLRSAGVYRRIGRAQASIESAPSYQEAVRRAVTEFRRRRVNEHALPGALERRAKRRVMVQS